MSANKILITGSRGYLGGRLLRDLGGARALSADVTDRAAVSAAIEQHAPARALIHLAAVNDAACAADPARAFAVNAVGTSHVMEAAAASAIAHVVVLSTFHVYGPWVEGERMTEARVPTPQHLYGITKLAAEHVSRAAAAKYGITLGILRLSNSVGAPADEHITRWPLVLLDLCRQAHATRRLVLQSSGLQWRDFVAIDDVVAAVRAVVAAPASALRDPVFNLGSGSSMRVIDLAEMVQSEYRAIYGEDLPLDVPAHEGDVPPTFTYDQSRMRSLGVHARADIRPEVHDTLRFCERFRS